MVFKSFYIESTYNNIGYFSEPINIIVDGINFFCGAMIMCIHDDVTQPEKHLSRTLENIIYKIILKIK